MPIKICKYFLNRALVFNACRYKSSLGLWNEEITTAIKHKIEKHWEKEILDNAVEEGKETFYVLPMFPYPSGNLHMGHVRVYSISDTIARFHKLDNKNVIHPIGWDAFGLPAENAAIERNILPQIWTNANITTMKEQLLQLGFNFDWDREISTCDPMYYKWTQYIFLKLFENGLAYQSKARVNWDPVDQTVLADEQVDDTGCSWRSGAKVEKKTLTQWFIKTTKYAQKLYAGLDSTNLENWKDIIDLQKHWIGECNGVVVCFHMKIKDQQRNFNVWSPDPYKFIHGEYVAISKDNVLIQDILPEDINSIKCFNPLTEKEIPVYVTDNLIYPEGRDVYIACPSVDSQDYNLSVSLNISSLSKQCIDIESENKKATDIAQKKGGYFVSSKLKDWLISRQRFWGTPIPIIHCNTCGVVPVPYDELPVCLPDKNSQESKTSTLSSFESWLNCKCPKCLGNARRESDTMDTFVDSSWYYYRFLDPRNDERPFDKQKLEHITPVNCYIGGKEHAVLHLYYARFMSYFLHWLGLTPTEEPFKKLLVQGMIMGQSYRTKSGKYLPQEDVEKVGKEYVQKNTGEPVVVQWEKMSKSKYNGENPQRLLSTYGSDTTRLLMLSDVPPATSRKWTDATLPGVLNFQNRLWITIRDLLNHRQNMDIYNSKKLNNKEIEEFETKLWNSRNYFIATATYHFKYTYKLSVGISRLQGLINALRNNIPPEIVAKSKEYEKSLASLIIMLSIVTPHFCSELWAGLQLAPNKINQSSDFIDWNKEVLKQKWPVVDRNYPLSFQCKVDGADRCELKIDAVKLQNLDQETALQMMIKEKPVADRIKRGILRTNYELYPDCRAILHIFTNRQIKNKPKSESDIERCRSQA